MRSYCDSTLFVQALQTSGLGDGHLSQLAAWNLQLQMAFERMSNIKEYR